MQIQGQAQTLCANRYLSELGGYARMLTIYLAKVASSYSNLWMEQIESPSGQNPTTHPSNPRRPRLHLTIGVTGHRSARLGDADRAELAAGLENLLAQLGSATLAVQHANAAVFSTETPCLRLVSALAEGADSLAAQAALAAGWRLDACLPFAPDIYRSDFAEAPARATYDSLLAQATAVFALPGSRDNTEAAYEAAGRVMLEQSDIVFALWDGEAARGRGGTAQIVEEAVARHVPVVHLDTRNSAPPLVLWSGLSNVDAETPTLDSVPRAAAADVLGAVAGALTIPPDNDVDRRMLTRFFDERRRKGTPALPYPLLLMMAGIKRLRVADFRPLRSEICADRLRRCLQANPGTGLYGVALQQRLIPQFGVADAVASYYAQVFRSGFVANFGLAGLAVLLASLGLLLPTIKLPLIAAELLLIFSILTNTRAGRRAGWHERWMDDRHLAEQLRASAVVSMLGDLDLRSGESRDAAVIPGWVRWLSRATTREMGLPSAVVDNTYLEQVRTAATTLIADQIGYHRTNAAHIRLLDHRLHHVGDYLFGGTVVACLAWIAMRLLGVLEVIGQRFDVTSFVTVITAVLPAMGASLYGTRMQGDFAGVADRASVMVKRLERLQRAIESDPLDFLRLTSRLRRLSDIMLTDVSNWRTTYQARPLTLPG